MALLRYSNLFDGAVRPSDDEPARACRIQGEGTE